MAAIHPQTALSGTGARPQKRHGSFASVLEKTCHSAIDPKVDFALIRLLLNLYGMSGTSEASAILHWSAETDPTFASPGDAEQLVSLGLNQRIVRVAACRDGWAEIRFGDKSFQVRESRLQPVEGVTFDVGDTVLAKGSVHVVTDIIWHFRDGIPNYFLERNGKRLSKRFLEHELTRS